MRASRVRALGIFLSILISLLVVAPLGFEGTTAQSVLNVNIVSGASTKGSEAFQPNPVVVSQGSVVSWINDDSVAHTVTRGSPSTGPVSSGFDSGNIVPGGSYSYAFYQPGEYAYYDKNYPGLTGKVIVTASSTTVSYIYAYTDRLAYNMGETVTAKGNVPDPDVNKVITFTVRDSGGSVVSVQQASPKADGSFSYSYTIPRAGVGSGQWRMIVAYGGLDSGLMFRVNPPNLPIGIVDSVVTDILGTRLEDLKAGQQGVIELTVANAASTQKPMVLILQVIGSDGSTEHITWLTTTLESRQSIKAGFGWVPTASGTFTVKAFAWESFKNPVALSEVLTSELFIG